MIAFNKNIIRCHRSFFVYLSLISKVVGTAKKPKFILKDLDKKMEIPVSKKSKSSIEN
jgi:DNA-binding LytR/AlgR family response regulator